MNERLTGEQDSRIWLDEIQQINHIHEGTNFDFCWRTWLLETNLEPAEPASDTRLIEVSKNVKWRERDGRETTRALSEGVRAPDYFNIYGKLFE